MFSFTWYGFLIGTAVAFYSDNYFCVVWYEH